MPGARCARGLVCNDSGSGAHERTGHTGITRHSPRNGLRLIRALPGDRAFLPPSSARLSANLTPASGSQDHTTSPSASGAVVLSTLRVHRSPPRERDDRVSPLWWDRMVKYIVLGFSSVKQLFPKFGIFL